MAIAFIDIETSSLIVKDRPLDDPAQPWAVHIAVDHCDSDGRSWNRLDVTIKADGRKIKEGAEAVHGLATRSSEAFGVNEAAVLAMLSDIAGKAMRMVSFGSFDPKVIESLLLRLEAAKRKPVGTYAKRWARPGLEFVNLQVPLCQVACKIPSGFGDGSYKWPTLDEACEVILGEPARTGHHDAWDDLSRLKRLYFALADRGHTFR